MKSFHDKIKVLIVEDDEDDFVLFKDYLEEIKMNSFEVEWIADYKNALKSISKNNHDLYVFDYLLGQNTGLELLKKTIEAGTDAPIILLTGKGDHKIDLQAMQLGAADYLIKGEIDAEKLERSIRYALENAATIRALKESEEKYRKIFERSRDMIYLTNEAGAFIDFNESATRIFGYTYDELKHLKAADLYYNKDEYKIYIDALDNAGTISDYEIIMKDKRGIKKNCILSGSVHHLSNFGKF
jgi:PAS domain S-box-containing protein